MLHSLQMVSILVFSNKKFFDSLIFLNFTIFPLLITNVNTAVQMFLIHVYSILAEVMLFTQNFNISIQVRYFGLF